LIEDIKLHSSQLFESDRIGTLLPFGPGSRLKADLPKEIKETFETEIKTFVYYDKTQCKLTGRMYNPNTDVLIGNGGDHKKGLSNCMQNSKGKMMMVSILNSRLDRVNYKALSRSQKVVVKYQVLLEFYERCDGGWVFRKDSYFKGEGFQATRLSWKQLLRGRWNIMSTIMKWAN
jgi:hypothetical protein